MIKTFETISSPRYFVESIEKQRFDVFKKGENAIKKCMEIALKFPQNKFVVIKKVNNEESIFFSISIDMKFDVKDYNKVFSSMQSFAKSEVEKSSIWR